MTARRFLKILAPAVKNGDKPKREEPQEMANQGQPPKQPTSVRVIGIIISIIAFIITFFLVRYLLR